MDYNDLILFEKQFNNKKMNYSNISNNNEIFFYNNRNNQINNDIEENSKYKKCYSVKPSIYMMPKDVIIKDIFHNEIMNSNDFIQKYILNRNINNNSNIDRKYILKKIKKFIILNRINYNIYEKVIYFYDLLFFQKDKIDNIYSYFNSLSNLSIAIIAFILILKFNNKESKMISLKKILDFFEEEDEKLTMNEVFHMEVVALKLIDYNLAFRTPFSFMELFLINGIIFNEDDINCDLSFNIYEFVNETLESIMECSNHYFKYNYFFLCCSIIMFIRERFKINSWPKTLEITFGIKSKQFYETYNALFRKTNQNNNHKESKENKNNIKNEFNFNLDNISNLKNVNNIISVLKIIKSPDNLSKVSNKYLYNNKNNKNDKEENDIFNDIKENSPTKIKVGLKKKRNFSTFWTPDKLNLTSILTKLTEDDKILFSNFYNNNKGTNNNSKDFNNNKSRNIIDMFNDKNYGKEEEKPYRKSHKIICSGTKLKEGEFSIIGKNISNSCTRFKNNFFINNNSKEKNNLNSNNIIIDSNLNNNTTLNSNIYRRRNFLNRKTMNSLISYNNKNIIKSECQKDNINPNNASIIDNLNGRINNLFFNNYNDIGDYDIKNYLKKINENNINITQTSFNNFLLYKNKFKSKINNHQENLNYLNQFKLKNKEEYSNAPTCESSNIRLSLNDFSIRKSYCLKRINNKYEENQENKLNLSPKQKKIKKYEKDERKVMETNKSKNELTNNKTSFFENTYRRTGVRKYYKQKNMENH